MRFLRKQARTRPTLAVLSLAKQVLLRKGCGHEFPWKHSLFRRKGFQRVCTTYRPLQPTIIRQTVARPYLSISVGRHGLRQHSCKLATHRTSRLRGPTHSNVQSLLSTGLLGPQKPQDQVRETTEHNRTRDYTTATASLDYTTAMASPGVLWELCGVILDHFWDHFGGKLGIKWG